MQIQRNRTVDIATQKHDVRCPNYPATARWIGLYTGVDTKVNPAGLTPFKKCVSRPGRSL